MRKSDIKRGTLATIAFSAVAFAAILLAGTDFSDGDTEPDVAAAGDGRARIDTITNSAAAWSALEPMDGEIERFMAKWHLKGVSLAVTRHDSLLYTRGYGWADREAGIPMEPYHIMRMASASKLVTAIAVMRLREQGRLRLDSRVFGPGGILDDTVYTNAIRDPRVYDITVDHLLKHEGGFTLGAGDPMFNTREIMAAKRLTTPPDSIRLTGIVLGRRLGFAPGHGRRYSNFGYMVLSLVIERLAGTDYWSYVQSEVLRPAGCNGFRPATNYYSQRSADEVRYYPPDDELVEEYNGSGRMVPRIYGGSDFHGLMGAGGWCASAAGLARLVAATDMEPGVADIISPESVGLLTAHSDSANISRGWSASDGNGKWTRTGTLSSSHTLIERFPDGECWVMITNSGVWTGPHFSRDMSRLVDHLRARYSGAFPARDLF